MIVKIKKMVPGRFASFYGYGNHPEEEAMSKLLQWCKKKSIDVMDDKNIIFGFNNPNPTPEVSEYGYEFWIKVDSMERPMDDVRITEYYGGDYAVTKCIGGITNMPETWRSLYKWCRDHDFKLGHHQPLEKITGSLLDIENLKIELYCPVIQK